MNLSASIPLFEEAYKQNQHKLGQVCDRPCLIFSKVGSHWKSTTDSPLKDTHGGFRKSEFYNQKGKMHGCLFIILNVKFTIYTIFIIPSKKQNLHPVGLQKQLLKSDVFINMLIRGIFPYSFGKSLKTNMNMV